MAEERFLVVRLSSLGDIAHTVPAVAALRESFPEARIDWLVEHKWAPLLAGSAALNEVIPLDRASWRGVQACVQQLRAARYTCAIDFQGLFKSAVLAWLSGAPRRVPGRDSPAGQPSGPARAGPAPGSAPRPGPRAPPIIMPLRIGRCDGFGAIHSALLERVRAILPSGSIHPLALPGGRALVMVAAYDKREVTDSAPPPGRRGC